MQRVHCTSLLDCPERSVQLECMPCDLKSCCVCTADGSPKQGTPPASVEKAPAPPTASYSRTSSAPRKRPRSSMSASADSDTSGSVGHATDTTETSAASDASGLHLYCSLRCAPLQHVFTSLAWCQQALHKNCTLELCACDAFMSCLCQVCCLSVLLYVSKQCGCWDLFAYWWLRTAGESAVKQSNAVTNVSAGKHMHMLQQPLERVWYAAEDEDNATILRDLFEGTGIMSAIDHSKIESANDPETRAIDYEASRIARQAADALRQSRRVSTSCPARPCPAWVAMPCLKSCTVQDVYHVRLWPLQQAYLLLLTFASAQLFWWSVDVNIRSKTQLNSSLMQYRLQPLPLRCQLNLVSIWCRSVSSQP